MFACIFLKNDKAHYEKYDLTFDNKRKKDPYPMDVYCYFDKSSKLWRKWDV